MKLRLMLFVVLLPVLVIGSSCSHAQKEGDAAVTLKKKSERKAFLGVSLQDMSAERAREMKVKTETGALVNSVEEESPAENAGIKDDDIVVEFNGKTIEDANDLVRAVRKAAPGETASVIVMRKDDKKSFQVKLGKAPRGLDPPSLSLVRPHVPDVPAPHVRAFAISESNAYGLEMMTLNKQLAEYFGAPDKKGVLVESVGKKSAAEKAGFKAGDVIVTIGKDRIEDTRDVWDAIEDFKEGEKINVEILRKGSQTTLTLEAEEQEVGMLFRHQFSPMLEEFRLQQHFENEAPEHYKGSLKSYMERLREEVKVMTKKIQQETRAIQAKVRREVQEVVGS